MENFQHLISNLNTFTWLTVNYTASTLERVKTALQKINLVAKEDTVAMGNTIAIYKNTFDDQYGNKFESVIAFMQNVEQILSYLEYRVLIANQTHGQAAFQSAIASLELLFSALQQMVDIENIPVESRFLLWAPDRLWTSRGRSEECAAVFLDESLNYMELKFLLNITLHNWYMLDIDGLESPGAQLLSMIWDRQAQISNITDCAREYKLVVNDALNNLNALDAAFNNSLETDFQFEYENVLEYVQEELFVMNGNITWLTKNLESYAKNETTKIELSELLTDSSVDALDQTMDSVLSKMDIHALVLLQKATENTKTNVRKWLHKALASMTTLVPYFDNGNLEADARTLLIWRVPVAELDTPDILRYTYQATETWRTWPMTTTILDLITTHVDEDIITDIVAAYGEVLYNEMYAVQLEFNIAKKAAVATFQTLVDDLSAFRQQSNIDKDFIL